jgi:magnesium-protoporphyrin O-methyltransferase
MAVIEKEIARFFDCCEPPGQRKLNTRLSKKARRELIAAVTRTKLEGKTVLEVGCGPGDLIRELVRAGASRASGIDLAEQTLEQARQKAADENLADRITFRVGNGAKDALDAHDIVVLDKVICCYPDWPGMIDNTSGAARSVYGFVIPRSQGWSSVFVKAFIGMGNFFLKMRRCGFRGFVHDYRKIDAHLKSKGFQRAHYSRGPIWMTAVYAR